MSLIDPRETIRTEPKPAAPTAIAKAGIVIMAGLNMLLGAGGAFGMIAMLDVFRLMAINEVGQWESRWGMSAMIMSTFVPFVWLALAVGFDAVGRKISPELAQRFLSFPFGALGATALTVWSGVLFTPPELVGLRGTGESQEAWGVGGWTMYLASYWVPALVAAATILLVVRAIRRLRPPASLRLGIRTAQSVGTIITVKLHGYAPDKPECTVTVQFRDSNGQNRFLTRRLGRRQPPTVGEVVLVTFDADDPGYEKTIDLHWGSAEQFQQWQEPFPQWKPR